MENESTINDERLREILRVMRSLGRGDFDHRVSRSDRDDLIESIGVTLNMYLDEMHATLHLYADLQHHLDYQESHHIAFILNNLFEIIQITPDVSVYLGYDSADLDHHSFSDLLPREYLELWRDMGSWMIKKQVLKKVQEVCIVSKSGEKRSCTLLIQCLKPFGELHSYYLVNVLNIGVQARLIERDELRESVSLLGDAHAAFNAIKRPTDRKVMGLVYQYILTHLEEGLPEIRKFAHQFGINETKLKVGFRQVYGISVFAFQKRERMRKGKSLLENTGIAVKEVAFLSGYTNASQFTRDFKRRFRCLRKITVFGYKKGLLDAEVRIKNFIMDDGLLHVLIAVRTNLLSDVYRSLFEEVAGECGFLRFTVVSDSVGLDAILSETVDFSFIFFEFHLQFLDCSGLSHECAVVTRLRRQFPNARLFLILPQDRLYLVGMLRKAVHPEGLVSETEVSRSTVAGAIRIILSGGFYYSPSINSKLTHRFKYDHLLDDRDRELLYELSRGAGNARLLAVFPVSLSTLSRRKRRLKEIFGVDGEGDWRLVERAREEGVV